MTPENFYLGGGVPETMMSPVAGAILLLAAIFILSLPRKYVVIPVLLAVFLVPRGMVLVVGGMHLMPIRIISFIGWVRVVRTEISAGATLFAAPYNTVDRAFMWSVLSHAAAFMLLWGGISAVTNQFGFLWSCLGMYFLLRYLIQDREELLIAIKTLAVIAVVNGIAMVNEQFRLQNLFGVLIGGVQSVPSIREGRIRSQGSFGYSILAGVYGATALPLFFLLWNYGRAKILGLLGAAGSMLMIFTSASSTPVSALVASALALCFWPLRKQMRLVRWAIVLCLIVLHLVMNAPVWFLVAHVDLVGGSGSHRAHLVDEFIRHFFDWWLLGTKDNGSWGYEMFDTSNTYVTQGQSGGLLAFVFFIAVISRSFGMLGRARRAVEGERSQEWLVWTLCVALFAHIIAFFGINYYDQTEALWYASLAIISAATALFLKSGVDKPALNALPLTAEYEGWHPVQAYLPAPTVSVIRSDGTGERLPDQRWAWPDDIGSSEGHGDPVESGVWKNS